MSINLLHVTFVISGRLLLDLLLLCQQIGYCYGNTTDPLGPTTASSEDAVLSVISFEPEFGPKAGGKSDFQIDTKMAQADMRLWVLLLLRLLK